LIAEKEDLTSILERRDQEIQRLTGIVQEMITESHIIHNKYLHRIN
jgi:hypothetical protein